MIARYSQLPEIVPTPLEQGGFSWFSVIVPVARTNLVANPSFETATTGWAAAAGPETLTRSTAQQYHGAYSLAIAPTANTLGGAHYNLGITTVAGTLYAYSIKVLGQSGVPYKYSLTTTGAVELAAVTFRGTGRWQWIYGYYLETANATRDLYITKNNSANTATFYIDGVQVEALGSAAETVSTYIDGSQQGLVPNQQPPAYGWNGTPHASTSFRSGLTRAGGMVVPLSNYNFLLAAIIGLGLATPQNVRTEYARIDGAYDDYTRKPTRQFSLVGRLSARSSDALDAFRSDLGALLDRDLVGLDQRMALRYEKRDGCGTIRSNAGLIPCKYVSGLDGNTDNLVAEQPAISFEQYLPYVQSEGEAGSSLTVQQTVTSIQNIAQRSATGNWAAIGGNANGAILALAQGLDGSIYAAGNFTSIGGVSANRIARWDGTTWNALATGLSTNSTRMAIAVAPNGDIVVGGDFGNADGVANTLRIARWNGTAWSALGTGANGQVKGLAYDASGNLYATGAFALMGGVANTSRVAKWNGTAWSALTTGLDTDGNAIVVAPDGSVFVTGDLTTAGGVPATRIAKWNPVTSTWSALGSGLNNTGHALVAGLNGIIYAGGTFTTAGGVSAIAIAAWNGVAWSALGGGLTDSTVVNAVYDLAVSRSGFVYAGGNFKKAGGISVTDGLAVWNGATWLLPDIDLPNSGIDVYAILTSADGRLTIGYDSAASTSGTAAALTTVTNGGTGKTYPALKITGPSSGTSRIYQILNTTTGRSIYLNYTINAGEIATFQFTPDNLSFVSSFSGNLANTILPGSNEADFFLQPGANIISLFSADSTVVAAMWWRPLYTSLDGLTR